MWAPVLYWGEDNASAGTRTPDRPTGSNVTYLVTSTGQDSACLFNKVKAVTVHAMEAYRGIRNMAPLFLYLGRMWM